MRYFKKELINKALILGNGKALTYDFVIDQTGVVAQNEGDGSKAQLISELSSMVGSAGLSEITLDAFEVIKKKQPSPMRETQSAKPRLFVPPTDPYGSLQAEDQVPARPSQVPTLANAVPVVEAANVRLAAAESPAAPAVAPAGSPTKFKPASRRIPRRGSSQ